MVVAVTIVSLFDFVAGRLHPLPAGLDPADPANLGRLKAHIAATPAAALALVLAGWIAGPFGGGLVASRVAGTNRRQYPWIIMALLFAATIANFFAFPHPTWMIVGAVLGIPSAAWWASRLAPPDEPR